MTDEELRAVFAALEAKMESRIDRLEATIVAGFGAVGARFDLLEARFDRLESRLGDLEEMIGRVAERLTLAQSHLQLVEGGISDLKARLARLSSDLIGSRTDDTARYTALLRRVTAAESALDRLRREIDGSAS